MKLKSLEEKFLEEIGKIKEAEIFLGIGKILSVQLMEEKDKPRDFVDILQDVIEKFRVLNRWRKKELLKILRIANKESLKAAEDKKEENGNRTENTET